MNYSFASGPQVKRDFFVFVEGGKEHFSLYTVHPSLEFGYVGNFGDAIVDFLYDPLAEEVVDFLLSSEGRVKRIRAGKAEEWRAFEHIIEKILSSDFNPFYYFLYIEFNHAYRCNLLDGDEQPLPNDYFVKLGKSLMQMREKLLTLLDAQSKVSNPNDILQCYREGLFALGVTLPRMRAELTEPTKKEPSKLRVVTCPANYEELLNFLLTTYISSNTRFKRCGNCEKFFATTGQGNPKFCNRLIEGTSKTCRQLTSTHDYELQAKRFPFLWLYNRAYKTMYSRINTGAITKELFREWVVKAREQRNACAEKEITPEDFSTWLCDNGLGIDYLKEKK